jgi:hypothetical protein
MPFELTFVIMPFELTFVIMNVHMINYKLPCLYSLPHGGHVATTLLWIRV